MDNSTRNHELSALHREYASYFPSCELVLTVSETAPAGDDIYAKLLSRKSPPSHLALTTQEGKVLKVTVGVNGWYLCDESQKSYETFESLLQVVSPAFKDEFAQRLSSRLQTLQR
ncbi:hypothetical protein JA9_000391 [Meyerozyma sp. JA9]|nr:hypothetical protein JA9_000391 [Meyerozyma sp. JA9]